MNEGDFAKIIRASNGQQVLIYFEPDDGPDGQDDTVAVIHCIARMNFGNVDLKAYVTSEEGVKRYMEAMDQEAVDRFVQKVNYEWLGTSSEVEKEKV